MCTIFTINREFFDGNSELVYQRIYEDAAGNPHGIAMLMSDQLGELTQLRTFDPQKIVEALYSYDWERVFIHCRYATGNTITLDTTHGFSAKGIYYMHNGILNGFPASRLPVDSMAIGKWLNDGTAVQNLMRESFANVFLIDPESGEYTVIKAAGGSLHTDSKGNYSTAPCGLIVAPVPSRYLKEHDMPITIYPSTFDYSWSANDPSINVKALSDAEFEALRQKPVTAMTDDEWRAFMARYNQTTLKAG